MSSAVLVTVCRGYENCRHTRQTNGAKLTAGSIGFNAPAFQHFAAHTTFISSSFATLWSQINDNGCQVT